MREPKNVRHLASKEEAIARSVFKGTVPLDQVLVSDGLGKDDLPFTVPTSMPVRIPFKANFNVKGGKYVIHAGDGYFGMSYLEKDRRLLIHELTHVWQGVNDTSWSWAYVIFSAKDQLLSGDAAYAYDAKRLKPWSHYGPEQQASIVEDWYAKGMNTFDPITQIGDRRFYYIKKHIWHEHVLGDWTMVPIKGLEAGKLDVKLAYVDYVAAHLLPVLEAPLRADDHAGIAARVRKLEEFFQNFSRESAQELLLRLDVPRGGDKLAQAFHYRLATPTRQRLLHILRTRPK